MENKKTIKTILFCLCIYMLLSWFITAGNFSSGEFIQTGHNQFGLFDFFLAPFELFNYFVVSMSKSIDGYVNQIGYINNIIAFASIGIFYGVLNKTGVYSSLIDDITNKLKNKKNIFILLIAIFYFVFSSMTGNFLVLFMFLPFLATILSKLKFRKITAFCSTIGAMLLGQISSIINPNINGINNILFQTSVKTLLFPKIILFLILLVFLISFIYIDSKKEARKKQEILLIDDVKKTGKNYVPMITIIAIVSILLFFCMYNWYYTFNITNVTASYDKIMNTKIGNYNILNNIFGMSEPFGYWTGFTMSGLLLLASFVIKFIYNIKLDDYLDGIKKGFSSVIPMLCCSILSLILIVISLHNGDSFIYTLIDKVLNIAESSTLIGIFSSGFIHNFFINDYFALLSSLGEPILSIFGTESLDISLFIAQVSHGIVSLLTPFNVYLIAGLSYLKISYNEWFKFIWKYLIVIILASLAVLFIIC